MSERTTDPFEPRLSDYVDGELAAGERTAIEEHLAGCVRCAALVADLRRISRQARSLGDREPARDLWPAVRASIQAPTGPRFARRWALAFAAGALLALALQIGFERLGTEPGGGSPRPGESYLLLLHEPAGFESGGTPEEHAAIVRSYAGWARGLGDRLLAGDELAEGGFELRGAGAEVRITERGEAARPGTPGPGDGPDPIGGYFLLRAAAPEEALAIARTCPHLERSGWIELRRVRD